VKVFTDVAVTVSIVEPMGALSEILPLYCDCGKQGQLGQEVEGQAAQV